MIDPVAFEIAGFQVRWYSIFILLAVGVAYFVIANEGKRFKIKKEALFDLMFWTLIMGILGARIYYVIFRFDIYKDNLSEIFKIWNGGLAIHGGIIAGMITIIVYTKIYKLRTERIFDILAPALMIGQAIGRWGNFFNQEAYGTAIEYSKLVNLRIIPQFIIDNMCVDGVYHLPMFYFESFLCIVGFLILIKVRRLKYIKVSQIYATYFIIYGVIRFFIEIFRTDALKFMGIKMAQVVSILMILYGIFIHIRESRRLKLENLYNKIG